MAPNRLAYCNAISCSTPHAKSMDVNCFACKIACHGVCRANTRIMGYCRASLDKPKPTSSGEQGGCSVCVVRFFVVEVVESRLLSDWRWDSSA